MMQIKAIKKENERETSSLNQGKQIHPPIAMQPHEKKKDNE